MSRNLAKKANPVLPLPIAGAGIRLSDVAYESLRDRIVRVEISPGAPLDEEKLRSELAVGLSPIRDALKRLSFERLVSVYPRRGTFASEINIADERWLTEVRLDIEGLAAALAAERAGDSERHSLTEIAQSIRGARTSAAVSDIDALFHRTMFVATHNPFLEATLHLYFNLALRIWYFCRDCFVKAAAQGQDHMDLASAIASGDPVRARAAARAHILHSSAVIRHTLHRNPD